MKIPNKFQKEIRQWSKESKASEFELIDITPKEAKIVVEKARSLGIDVPHGNSEDYFLWKEKGTSCWNVDTCKDIELPEIVVCKNCNKPFQQWTMPQSGQQKERILRNFCSYCIKYCSPKSKTCDFCGQGFNPLRWSQKHCLECAKKIHYKKLGHKKEMENCLVCNKQFKPKTTKKYCSEECAKMGKRIVTALWRQKRREEHCQH